MKFRYTMLCSAVCLIVVKPIFAQEPVNCFLADFEPKSATIPPYEEVEKTTKAVLVTVTINTADTLGKVSQYLFGHALAAWLGNDVNNPVLLGHLQKLAPTLIRYPGGSWADIFFWSGNPGDLPNTIPDGANNGQRIPLAPQFGANSWTTTLDNYYLMRDQVHGTQGLITINYGYARYGLSEKPAEQAAHYAAEWVRHDHGRTKFWEIGNENAGPWEAGWQIDTTANKDGQPEIISGELYGRHFKIFADSMRAAAAALGTTIYIGGQVLHYDGTNDNWNPPNKKWNEGFFQEAGDAADFYVFHNYFGNSASNLRNQIDAARTTINQNIAFIRQDLVNKQAAAKPLALTEWNLDVGSDTDNQKRTSIANGMQAVVLACEMIKNNLGMSSRWLIANWESDGMFYKGNNAQIPVWNPRPDFFYFYYLQKFVGDHVVSTSVSPSTDVLAYATTFHSKHAGVVVVNRGNGERIVKLATGGFGVGERFYVYSLTGIDDSSWPQGVFVNDEGPSSSLTWGPVEGLEQIPAYAYQVGDEIKFVSPARSVQFILIEPGDRVLAVKEARSTRSIPAQFRLYPNPASNVFNITLQAGTFNKVDVVDLMGRIVYSREIAPSEAALQLQPKLASGSYFVRLHNEKEVKVTKLLISK